MEIPGESYLHYAGLHTWLACWDDLAAEISDAILDAADQVLADACVRDPMVQVLLADRVEWSPWSWVPSRAGDLPVGTRISVRHQPRGWYGHGDAVVCEVAVPTTRDREWHPDDVPHRPWSGARIGKDMIVDAWLPRPVDFTTAVQDVLAAAAAKRGPGAARS